MDYDNRNNEKRNKVPGEEIVLTFLFGFLLVGVFSILYVDFKDLTGMDSSFPFLTREKVTSPILPADENDQLRRYSPNIRMDFGPVGKAKLPGVKANADDLLQGAMTFHDGGNGSVSAIGFIGEGKAIEFERFIAEREGKEPVRKLYLHSPGGSVRDALEMARFIRKHKIETILTQYTYCASSCPLVFSGGIKRKIEKPAALGVHQIFAGKSAKGTLQQGIANAQSLSAEAQNLLVDMGVDPRAWIKAMQTPKDKIYIFTDKEITQYLWVF